MKIAPSARLLLTALSIGSLELSVRAQFAPPPGPGQIGLSLSTKITGSGEAKLKGGNTTFADVEIGRYEFDLRQHFRFEADRSLVLGLEYGVTDIDGRDGAGQVPLPDELQSLNASARYFQRVAPQWMLSTALGVGSHVTDTGLLSEGWGFNTSVMGLYNRSQSLTWIFGIAYNSRADDWRVVPILGFDWRPAEKWSVAFGFPRTGITYKLSPQLSLSLAASGAGGSFYVKNDPQPGTAPRSLADSKLEYTDVRLGFGANWKINATFRLSGTVGQVLYRRFNYIDRSYELKSRNTVPFLSLGGSVSL